MNDNLLMVRFVPDFIQMLQLVHSVGACHHPLKLFYQGICHAKPSVKMTLHSMPRPELGVLQLCEYPVTLTADELRTPTLHGREPHDDSPSHISVVSCFTSTTPIFIYTHPSKQRFDCLGYPQQQQYRNKSNSYGPGHSIH